MVAGGSSWGDGSGKRRSQSIRGGLMAKFRRRENRDRAGEKTSKHMEAIRGGRESAYEMPHEGRRAEAKEGRYKEGR